MGCCVCQNYIGVCVSWVPAFILVYDPALNCAHALPQWSFQTLWDRSVCIRAPLLSCVCQVSRASRGFIWSTDNIAKKIKTWDLILTGWVFDMQFSWSVLLIWSPSYFIHSCSQFINAFTPQQTFCYDSSDSQKLGGSVIIDCILHLCSGSGTVWWIWWI